MGVKCTKKKNNVCVHFFLVAPSRENFVCNEENEVLL